MNIIDLIVALFKNFTIYLMKGILYVAVAHSFVKLRGWVVGDNPQLFAEVMLMSFAVFILDNVLVPENTSSEQIPTINQSKDKCECVCNCEYPATMTGSRQAVTPVASLAQPAQCKA